MCVNTISQIEFNRKGYGTGMILYLGLVVFETSARIMFRNVLVNADQSYGSFAYISLKMYFQENNNFQFNEHTIHVLLDSPYFTITGT